MYKDKLKSIINLPAIKDIFAWSKTSHRSIFLICLLKTVLSAGSLVITVATKGLIDGATSHNSDQVKLYAIIMTTTVIVIRLCAVFNSLLNTKTNALLLRDMRTTALNKIFKKRYDKIGKFHSGELVNRMFSDVSVVKNGIMNIIPQLVSMAISFIGAAYILISMDWRFVILLIIGGIVGLVLMVVFKKPLSTRHNAVQESEGKLHAIIQESLGNIRLIKASGSEKRIENQTNERQDNFLKVQLNRGYFSTAMNSSIGLVFHLSWLFCMLWGCRGIYKGVLTYGSLAAIIQLVGQIQGPIASAADIVSECYSTVTSAQRLKDILDLPEEEELETRNGLDLYKKLQSIKLKDIYFDYDREPVLKNVNTEIKPGDFVAITGISGGGKSTLFRLLLGIYEPKSGEVQFICNDKIRKASKKTRPLFAYVPQGNILFSGTVRENLLMFTDSATDEEIEAAVKAACIDELIASLDNGYDTLLGERGIGLSEGQAQRVAVARALLSKAPILLLDESTSALDEQTEAKLLTNISKMKDKTCFIVTHRRAALSICDYRLHLENGEITKLD